MIALLIIILFCAWLAYVYIKHERTKLINIPGKKGLPFVGSLLDFLANHKFHILGFEWAQKYGKMNYFRVFGDNFVSINDAKLVRELYSTDQLSGRKVVDIFLLYEGESYGIINTQGELWETHRRFTLRQLRDFGFGKNTMEMLIMDEVNELVSRLKRHKGAPVGSIKELFSLAVVNSLWTVVSGKRYNQEDPKLQAIANSLNRALTASAESGGIIFFLPWLRYIIPDYTGYTEIRKAFETLKAFVKDAVKEHRRTYQSDTVRDFIDVYLKEMESTTDPKSTFYGEEGEKQLINVVGDLFFAGTDTTSTTLAWAILYLASHPHCQKKLQAEISEVSGDSREISVADRPNMPYLQATIDEVLRLSSIIPGGVQHQVLNDFEWQGVTLRKNTMVSSNIYYIHHNPDLWESPESFVPERFLSDDGKVFKKSENIIPFSLGKRQCLGEKLARDTLFLFIASIFQNFNVDCDPNNPNPSLEPAIGFSLNPQEYSVLFKSRSG